EAERHLDGEQRVAAEGEEVVLGTDPLASQDFAPQAGHQLFGRSARGQVRRFPRRRRRRNLREAGLEPGGLRLGEERLVGGGEGGGDQLLEGSGEARYRG